MLNRRDIASIVAYRISGYTIADVEQVIDEVEKVICEALSSGEDVKLHKLIKLYIRESPEHKAYNGVTDTYYTAKAKKQIGIRPLSMIDKAEEKLNKRKNN